MSEVKPFDFTNYSDDCLEIMAPLVQSGSTASPVSNYVDSMTYNLSARCAGAYLSSLVIGSTYGSYRGFLEARKNTVIFNNRKLLVNSILNGVSKYGSKLANHCGIFAMIYSLSRSFFVRNNMDKPYKADSAGAGLAMCFTTIHRGIIFGSVAGMMGFVGGYVVSRAAHRYTHGPEEDQKSL